MLKNNSLRMLAFGMVSTMLLAIFAVIVPAPSDALTTSYTNNTDYDYWDSGDASSYVSVNVGLAITRISVQFQVYANTGNGNDVLDLDVIVYSPDNTQYQLVNDATTYSGNVLSTTFYNITFFNVKSISGNWRFRVLDNSRVGGNVWNTRDGYIDSWTITFNYQEPVVTLTAPANPNLPVAGNLPVSTSVVGYGMTNVKMYLDNGYIGDLPLTAMSSTDSTYAGTVNTLNYLDGRHTLAVVASDWGGRTDTKSVQLIFDNYLPSLTFTTPVQNSCAGATRTFLVSGANGEASMSVHFTVNSTGGRALVLDALMAGLGGGLYGFGWDTTGYADGSYNIGAYSVDAAGNNVSIGPFRMTVDNTAPALDITSPTSGAYISGSLSLTLAAADINGRHTQYRVDGNGWQPANPAWNTEFTINTSAISDGAHRIGVRALDRAGWETEGYVDITVNNAAPPLAIVYPAEGNHVQGTASFRARVPAFLPVTTVSFTVDSTTRQAGYNTLSGYYELAVDTAQLADGPHQVSAEARDASGQMLAANSIQFNTDNRAPVVGIEEPRRGARVFGTVTMKSTVTDAFLTPVTCTVDNRPETTMSFSDGAYSTQMDTTALPDGAHRLTVTARDIIGHSTVVSVDVIVDNSVPAVELASPVPGAYVDGAALFQVKATNLQGIASVVLQFSGALGARTLGLNAATGFYETTLDTTAVADGNYTAWATVTGLNGAARSTANVSFRVDNLAPVLTLGFPRTGAYVTGVDGARSVSAESSDVFLMKVEYDMDGAGYHPLTKAFTELGLADGKHSLTVRAIDGAGHVTEVTSEFWFDNTAPSVAVTAPESGVHLAGKFILSVRASDMLGIVSVTATPDTVTKADAKELILNPATGLYETVFDTSRWAGGDRMAGIEIVARDSFGHRTNRTVTVFSDNTAPGVVKNSPPGNSDKNVLFKFTVTDSTAVKSVQLRLDNGAWKTLPYNQKSMAYSYSWSTGLSENGNHRYDVKVTDTLGNEATAAYGVEIKNPDNSWVMWLLIVLLIGVAMAVPFVMGRKKEGAPEPAPEPVSPPQPAAEYMPMAPERPAEQPPVPQQPAPPVAPQSPAPNTPSGLDQIVGELNK